MPKCKPKLLFATKKSDVCLNFTIHLAYRIVPANMLNTLALYLSFLDLSQGLVGKQKSSKNFSPNGIIRTCLMC